MRRAILLFAVFFAVAVCQAETVYVDANATGANNGTSWVDAYKYLQDALADANPNGDVDEIWIAQGIYTPDSNSSEPSGSGDRNAKFQLINGVTIKGGFAGFGQPDPNTRDIELYKTILSGDLLGNDNPATPVEYLLEDPYRADNSYHVFFHKNLDSNAVLDGVIITGGNGNSYHGGSGMYNSSSNPTLTNCTFSKNSAFDYGGGMLNNNSNPTVTDCTFSSNSAYRGGGIRNDNSSPTLTGCTFIGNSAKTYGGGIENWARSSPTISNCTFISNSTKESNGGAIYNWFYSSPILTNCAFIGNSADWSGGGICNSDYSNPTVNNCLFSDNTGRYGGAMINGRYSSPTVNNCTYTRNSAYVDGDGILNIDDSSPTLKNCILWDNGEEIYNYDASCVPIIDYCDIQGGYPSGTNIIDVDPLFFDADGADNTPGTEDDNLRLSADSPCIDAGDPNYSDPLYPTDLDGRDRFVDGDCNSIVVADMGAYEFTYAYMGDFDSDCEVDFKDYAIQAGFWMTDELLVDIAPTPAGDGIVDIYDLSILCDNWLAGK